MAIAAPSLIPSLFASVYNFSNIFVNALIVRFLQNFLASRFHGFLVLLEVNGGRGAKTGRLARGA